MRHCILIPFLGGLLIILSIASASSHNDACGKIAFISDRDGNWDIFSIDADGSHQTNLTRNTYLDRDPSWSPDGQKIVFSTANPEVGSGFCIMNADGTNQKQVSKKYKDGYLLSWSPDGERIALVSPRYFAHDICLINTEGTDYQNLLDDPFWDSNPCWSPDGKKIAFTSNREGRWEIYTMDSDGTNIKKLLSSPVFDSFPDWSPDGEKIAFSSRRDLTADIYVVDADGANLKRLTNDRAYDSDPSWSPDGKRIVFYSDRDGDPGLYVMDLDGGNIQRLTNDSFDNWSPHWCCSQCGKSQEFKGLREFSGLLGVAILLILLKANRIMTVRNIAFVSVIMSLLLVAEMPSNAPRYNQDMCSLCRGSIETAQNLHEEVVVLMEQAEESGLVTSEMDKKHEEATRMLNQASLSCFKSSNCVAGNTLARRSFDILENLKSELEFVLEGRKDEYAVYSTLLQEWYYDGIGYINGEPTRGPVQFYVIHDYTSTDDWEKTGLGETLEYVCGKISQPIDQEIIDDFLEKNAQSYPLGDFFRVPATVILISRTEIRDIFGKGLDYYELSARYPFSPGAIAFSRVGFNAQRDHALVYVGSMESYDCGGGYYVLLVRENNVWKFKASVCTWVS
jgi:Tol biopolymer transport system component